MFGAWQRQPEPRSQPGPNYSREHPLAAHAVDVPDADRLQSPEPAALPGPASALTFLTFPNPQIVAVIDDHGQSSEARRTAPIASALLIHIA